MFMLIYIGIIAALKIAIVLMRWRRLAWSNGNFYMSLWNMIWKTIGKRANC